MSNPEETMDEKLEKVQKLVKELEEMEPQKLEELAKEPTALVVEQVKADLTQYLTPEALEAIEPVVPTILSSYNVKVDTKVHEDGSVTSSFERCKTRYLLVGCIVRNPEQESDALKAIGGAVNALAEKGWLHGHLCPLSKLKLADNAVVAAKVVDGKYEEVRDPNSGGICYFILVHCALYKFEEAARLSPFVVVQEGNMPPRLEDVNHV